MFPLQKFRQKCLGCKIRVSFNFIGLPQFIDYTNWYRVGPNKSATVGSGSGHIEVQDFTMFKYCTPIYVALADPRGLGISTKDCNLSNSDFEPQTRTLEISNFFSN